MQEVVLTARQQWFKSEFSKVTKRWSPSAISADVVMHIGALFTVYLIVLGGFHMPPSFTAPAFVGAILAFLAAFFCGIWILGTVFPDHYVKQKPLRYDGVYVGLALSFIGGTGFFVLIAMSLTAFSLGMWVVFYVLYWVNVFGITIGYHRLATHRAFKCGSLFMRIFLVMGATARQRVVDWWGRIHRIHHEYTEIEAVDPHTPRESFWHSDMGWVWRPDVYPDTIWNNRQLSIGLADDPLVQEQKRYGNAVMVLGFALAPVIFGALGMWNDGEITIWQGFMAGTKAFLLTGLLRFACSFRITMFVNSWSHTWGPQPYKGKNVGDSRDAWVLSPFSAGETLQNIHHLMDSIACYWAKRHYIDFSGALIVALERLGRFRWLKWAGLPYELKTIGPAQLRFMNVSSEIKPAYGGAK